MKNSHQQILSEIKSLMTSIKTQLEELENKISEYEQSIDVQDLDEDLHFYHDVSGTKYLYLYSEENPGNRFESIEFNMGYNLISVKGDGVTVDNLCLKYTGVHGVGAGTVNRLTVQNCEFGWIGGKVQGYTARARTLRLRTTTSTRYTMRELPISIAE